MIALDPNFSVTGEDGVGAGAIVDNGDGFEFAKLGDEGMVEVGLSVFDFEWFDVEAFEGGDLGGLWSGVAKKGAGDANNTRYGAGFHSGEGQFFILTSKIRVRHEHRVTTVLIIHFWQGEWLTE